MVRGIALRGILSEGLMFLLRCFFKFKNDSVLPVFALTLQSDPTQQSVTRPPSRTGICLCSNKGKASEDVLG